MNINLNGSIPTWLNLWPPFWRVAAPYWQSSEKWGALILLLLLFGLALISAGLLVLVSLFLGEVTSALAAQERERFMQALAIFLGVIVIGVPLLSLKTYVQAKLGLYWRNWLTERFLQQYLNTQQFYQLNLYSNFLDSNIDNPDQRIAEDIKIFTQQSLFFAVVVFDSLLQLAAFTGVLWSISQLLMVFLILYAVIGTFFTAEVFGRPLVGINAEQLKREADFRFSLVRVRENAEAIAFYQGQEPESQQAWQRFLAAFRNFQHLIRWQLGLNLFQNSYQYFTFLLPALILAPSILAGEREVGVEAQAGTAFRIILLALALIVKQFEQLTALIASVERLDHLANFAPPEPNQRIERVVSDRLAVHQLTLMAPDGTPLISNLSLMLAPNESLLIMGASGVGKSSLLRAIAGLWTWGNGRIEYPEPMLLLPQRPYMSLGSLRDQITYPHVSAVPDSLLLSLLTQVNLSDLAERFGGLEAVADWSQVLSIGEQQRLAFARLLLAQPRYALLDEATSGLDEANERQLYQQLQASNITYLSVGHRPSLRAYHQSTFEMVPLDQRD
nr:MAG: ABC transporter ATP-binding protein/permease [Leptolyngbya sp. IPPAS B-1204]